MLAEEKQRRLSALRQRYDEGTLSGDALSALMLQAIEAEAKKPAEEMDGDWLSACGELMAYADRDKLARLPQHAPQLRRRLAAAMHREEKAQRAWSAQRVAVMAACFVLIFIGLSLQWFRPTQSTDEQVYTITGKEVNLGAVEQASATGDETLQVCETTDLQELCAFLGYTPALPTWVPEGWVINSYYASIDSETQWVGVSYEKAGEKYLLSYDHTQSSNVSDLSVDFYQDGAGEYVRLENGLKIYLTTNLGDLVAIWTKSNSFSSASGPVNVEELSKFILSIR